MKQLFRLLALLLVVPATYYFIYWVPFSLFPFSENRWLPSLVSLLCAADAGRYAWKKVGAAPASLLSSIGSGAVLLGAIGFCGGFFGPMIFAPGANQGPLLGIFITGPLGFLIGGVGGLVYWLAKGKKADTG